MALLVSAGCNRSSPTDPSRGGDLRGHPAHLRGQLVVVAGVLSSPVEVTIGGQTTTSAADGSFSLDRLSSGEAELAAVPVAGLLGSATGTIFLLPGENVRSVILTDNDSGILFGRVLDGATGRPIAGAEVEIPPDRRTVSDADGVYLLNACCSTITSLFVRAPGYRAIATSIGRVYGGSRALDFLMEAQ